jgi:hypothetical protein
VATHTRHCWPTKVYDGNRRCTPRCQWHFNARLCVYCWRTAMHETRCQHYPRRYCLRSLAISPIYIDCDANKTNKCGNVIERAIALSYFFFFPPFFLSLVVALHPFTPPPTPIPLHFKPSLISRSPTMPTEAVGASRSTSMTSEQIPVAGGDPHIKLNAQHYLQLQTV